jgi:hypothetical protein
MDDRRVSKGFSSATKVPLAVHLHSIGPTREHLIALSCDLLVSQSCANFSDFVTRPGLILAANASWFLRPSALPPLSVRMWLHTYTTNMAKSDFFRFQLFFAGQYNNFSTVDINRAAYVR